MCSCCCCPHPHPQIRQTSQTDQSCLDKSGNHILPSQVVFNLWKASEWITRKYYENPCFLELYRRRLRGGFATYPPPMVLPKYHQESVIFTSIWTWGNIISIGQSIGQIQYIGRTWPLGCSCLKKINTFYMLFKTVVILLILVFHGWIWKFLLDTKKRLQI